MNAMLGVDGRVFRLTWSVFVAAGLLALLFLARAAVFVFVLAVLFAYVIWPLVAIAEKLLKPALRQGQRARLVALALVYPVVIGAAIWAGSVMAPQIGEQAATLVEKTTAFAGLQQGRGRLPALDSIRDQVLAHAKDLVPYLQSAAKQLLHYLSNLWLVVLVPILSFFLLKDAEHLVAGVESWIVGQQQRDLLREIFADLHSLLAQYMRALVILSLLTFGSHALFFWLTGVPYALLLATLAGILEFIPMVGPLAAAALIVLASWLAGYPHLLWILVFLVVWRLIQDYVNMPWVLGSGAELHPLLVIFGILAGAELAGVAGMFLSIPAMAAARILVRRGLERARAAS